MSVCCPKPELQFNWGLGVNEDGDAMLEVSAISCKLCGRQWGLDHKNDTRCPLVQCAPDEMSFVLTVRPKGLVQ